MNFYRFIISRLNGEDIEKDFNYYLRLVRKGIAGFIIFGGRLETVREGIKELQKEAKRPLIIASDLEQGLGQQLEGGTLFPPAMAIASAITPSHPPFGEGITPPHPPLVKGLPPLIPPLVRGGLRGGGVQS
jgi:hypothetical protein